MLLTPHFFWGMHQSEEGGEFDFTDPHDIDKLLAMAAEEGLYVIARPGPYINAEVSMGGLPTWMVNKMAGSLRSTDPSVLDPSKAGSAPSTRSRRSTRSPTAAARC